MPFATLLATLAILAPSTRARVVGHTILFVPDGDGMKLRRDADGTVFMTRLCGIDCPEIGQRGEHDAQRFLRTLVTQHDYTLHAYARPDIHGRTLVSLLVRSNTSAILRSVSAELVARRLCVVYEQYLARCIDADAIRAARPSSATARTAHAPAPARANARANATRPYPVASGTRVMPWDYRRTVERILSMPYISACRVLRKGH